MNKETTESIKKIVWALRQIVSLVYQDSKKMNKKYGVTGPQSIVLKTLASSNESMSSANLSRLLSVTPSNLTGIIDRLEEKGLIVRIRKSDDRRTVLIELTDKGIDYSQNLPDLIEEKLAQGLGNLTLTEIFGIYSALINIIDIIGKIDIEEYSLDQE